MGKTEAEITAITKKHYDRAVTFYRAMGFRKIGFSKWFGLALDSKHSSRQVAIEADLDTSEGGLETKS